MKPFHKARKLLKISFEIALGYRLDHEAIRRENIDFIFVRTIHPLSVIEAKYDAIYKTVKDNERAKQITLTSLNE